MLKRLGAALVAALTVTLTVVGPAQASSGAFISPGTVTMLDGCFYVNYQVQLQIDSNVTSWSLDGNVLKPDGTVEDFIYEYGSTPGSPAFAEKTLLCKSLDPVGTYALTGTLTTYDASYSKTVTPLPNGSFTVVAPAAPPPPPPPPPAPVLLKSTTKVWPPDHAYSYGEDVAFKVRVRTPDSSVSRAVRVRIEYRSGSSWQLLDKRRIATDRIVWLRGYVFKSHSDLGVRVKTLPSTKVQGSKSDVVKFRAAD